jgi:MOSC domain-containing protein YiiM
MTAGARVVQIVTTTVPVRRTSGIRGMGRVYARVLREGSLASGEPVQLLTEDMPLTLIGRR